MARKRDAELEGRVLNQPAPPLREAAVAAFLRANPDFLKRHPDLCSLLDTPTRFDDVPGVVDLQSTRIRRQADEIAKLRGEVECVLQSARGQGRALAHTLRAAEALLGARCLEHLIDVVTTDISIHLEVDAVMLCLEGDRSRLPRLPRSGLRVLAPGSVDRLVGAERNFLLRAYTAGDPALFGSAAGLVASDALIRLRINHDGPPGLLALGAREAGRFDPGQGTELLGFLARVVERTIASWLYRAH